MDLNESLSSKNELNSNSEYAINYLPNIKENI